MANGKNTHQELMTFLTPMLGEGTAGNIIRHYCGRMKLQLEELQPAHLNDLATSMKPMLAVWLGTAGATRVASEIAQMGRRLGAQ